MFHLVVFMGYPAEVVADIYVFAVDFNLFRTYHLTRSSVATESSTEE